MTQYNNSKPVQITNKAHQPIPTTLPPQMTDASGRFRVSQATNIIEFKNVYTRNEDFFSEKVVGAGASITKNTFEPFVRLNVGTASGESASRTTLEYAVYTPGKSHQVLLTFCMGAAKANVRKRVGYFDADDGLFLEQNGTTDLAFTIRSGITGSPVEVARVIQANWNLDPLDGLGPSGITLDLSKEQLLIIDFKWMGVGGVTFGFEIDGQYVACHRFDHANYDTEPYLSAPTLPCRFEITNVGVSASSSTLCEICSAVLTEGDALSRGFEYAAHSGIVGRSISARTPVFAIRLKTAFQGHKNRIQVHLLQASSFVTGNDTLIELVRVHKPSGITATWTSVANESAVEYSTNISAVTGTPSHIIDGDYIPTGQGGKGGTGQFETNVLKKHATIFQNEDSNNSEMLVIYATPLSGSSTVYSIMNWIETE